jgi:integrase
MRLRVYSNRDEKTRYFTTEFKLTEEEFNEAWMALKPKAAFKSLRLRLQALDSKANEVAEKIIPFDFEKFEKSFFRESATSGDAVYFYKQAIDSMISNHQYGTTSSYELSLKSFQDFITDTTGKRVCFIRREEGAVKFGPDHLPFTLITSDWLMRYEKHMILSKGKSKTTVSMYLRTLKAIFNTAIDAGEVTHESYPFGRKRYTIPAVKNIKKALDINQLRGIHNATTSTPEQEKARDFFLFSYACNGMNIKDIALLKWEAIQDDRLIFYRAKTASTTKSDQKPTEVILTPLANEIIKKHGKPSSSPKDYVFNILSHDLPPEKQYHAVKNFTRFINQHLKKLAISAGITDKISTYFARHSFATNAREIGMPLHIIKDSLGHNKITTTENYLKSLPDNNHREWMNKLTDFT